jgi:hypothetical protein
MDWISRKAFSRDFWRQQSSSVRPRAPDPAGDLLAFSDEKAKVFEVFIQLGAILSVVWLYREKLLNTVRGLADDREAVSCTKRNVAFVPAAVVGPRSISSQGIPFQSHHGGRSTHCRRGGHFAIERMHHRATEEREASQTGFSTGIAISRSSGSIALRGISWRPARF